LADSFSSGFEYENTQRKGQGPCLSHLSPRSVAPFDVSDRVRTHLVHHQTTYDVNKRSPCNRKADDTEDSRRLSGSREREKPEGRDYVI